MACPKDPYPRDGIELGDSAPLPESATSTATPYLVVSNAPEVIAAALGTIVLYKCEFSVTALAPETIRVFLWHVNKVGSDRVFAILGSLQQGSGVTVSTRRFSSGTASATGDFSVPGISLACATHYRSFQTTDPTDVTLSTTEAVLWEGTAENNQLLGVVLEIDIVTALAANLRLRTVCTPVGGTIPGWDAQVAAPGSHIRGWWPRSSCDFPVAGTLNADPVVGPLLKYVAVINSATSPELAPAAFGWQGASLDPHGSAGGNRGAYGGTVWYIFAVENRNLNNLLGGVQARLLPRDTGAKFWGAGQALPSTLEGVIPKLGYDQDNESVKLHDAWVAVPAGSNLSLRVGVSPGGGAGLPINIVLETNTQTGT